jgi:hypothetical protein
MGGISKTFACASLVLYRVRSIKSLVVGDRLMDGFWVMVKMKKAKIPVKLSGKETKQLALNDPPDGCRKARSPSGTGLPRYHVVDGG